MSIFIDGDDGGVTSYDEGAGGSNAGGTSVEYLSVSGSSGGSGLFSQFNIGTTPTCILIAPNDSIVEQDIWPIGPSAPNALDSTLALYNISKTAVPVVAELDKPERGQSISVRNEMLFIGLDKSSGCSLALLSLDGKKLASFQLNNLPAGESSLSLKSFGSEIHGVNIVRLESGGRCGSVIVFMP